MIRQATAMMLRQNLGELLTSIQCGHDQVVITKRGRPVAAMVDVDLFQKICLMKRESSRLGEKLAAAYAGVDQQAAEKEVAAAVRAVRKR